MCLKCNRAAHQSIGGVARIPFKYQLCNQPSGKNPQRPAQSRFAWGSVQRKQQAGSELKMQGAAQSAIPLNRLNLAQVKRKPYQLKQLYPQPFALASLVRKSPGHNRQAGQVQAQVNPAQVGKLRYQDVNEE